MSSFCQITILDNLLLWNPWRKFPQKNKVNPQAEHFQLQVNFTNPILCLSFIGKNTNGGEIRQIPTMRPPTSYKWRAASLHAVGGNVAQKIAMLPVRGGAVLHILVTPRNFHSWPYPTRWYVPRPSSCLHELLGGTAGPPPPPAPLTWVEFVMVDLSVAAQGVDGPTYGHRRPFNGRLSPPFQVQLPLRELPQKSHR